MGGVFNKDADQVVRRARDEAVSTNHSYIGPEHLLLALLEHGGVVSELLNACRVAPDEVRRQVERMVQPGDAPLQSGRLPLTPLAKRAIESALEESQLLQGTTLGVGPEFILLGLLHGREGVTAYLMTSLGLRLDTVREHLKHLPKLGGPSENNADGR
jgi:ATP-dependent Clp protease ATP-binding subunit ClpC